MKIREIIKKIEYISAKVPRELYGREIRSLCHNSRYASPTCLFFCKTGAMTDGHIYAPQAYMNGARLFIAERELDLPEDAAVIIVENSNEALKRLAVFFYGDPAKDLRLIGITGTKGKTTVALSVYYIGVANGIKMGYIGTNGIYYNGKVLETTNTTPDVLELQKALRNMVDEGVTVVVIEVSSQALWQERVYGINFEICAFTNLYEDHIGGVEHPTFEHYMACKKALFSDYGAKNIIVNADSDAYEYMIDGIKCNNIIKVSARGCENCDLFAKNSGKTKSASGLGVSFDCFASATSSISLNEHGAEVFIPIPGMYSVENGLLTMAICSTLGLEIESVIEEMESLRIPGRFETVELEGRPESTFVIDYAHNGASLSAVLRSLREYDPKRIICLFGSVGGRTFKRRAELARAAKDGADVIIITSDNPDTEDPMKVIEDIYSEISNCGKEIYLISNRKVAIEKAYSLASAGDIVLLAGKGHESYQLVRGERIPFSERKILECVDALAPITD